MSGEWMEDAYVLNVSTRALIGACFEAGLDVTPRLGAVGITRGALDAPSGRLRASSAQALWAWAHANASSPDFSLQVARSVPFGSYQLVDFLVSSAPMLEHALRSLAVGLPTINPALAACVYEAQGVLHFELQGLSHLSYAEFVMSVCYVHCNLAFGMDIPLKRVEFAFSEPADLEAHERLFSCPVHFGASCTRMSLDTRHKGVLHRHSNAALHATLREHMRETLERIRAPRTITDMLRALMLEEMRANQEVSLASAAKCLGVSARTLQRQLRKEKRTFHTVHDSLRETYAYELLAQPERSLAEVSYMLGFSEQSAFHRAFRRWTGTTPRSWRERSAPASSGFGAALD